MDKKNVRIRLFKDNSRYKGDLFASESQSLRNCWKRLSEMH